MKNRYGAISGRAIKPIGLRVVAELRDAGFRLPIIATAGIRDLRRLPRVLLGRRRRGVARLRGLADPMPLYALGPIEGLRIRRLIARVARTRRRRRAPHWSPRPAAAS